MIWRVTGELVEKSAAGVVVDVGGVAFEIAVSVSTLASLPENGARVMLYTHFVMREDGVHLYGFLSQDEKQLFLLLNTVSKIGPKLALAILGGMDTKRFREAVTAQDISRLSSIPGIGKKTAERIVVELKDKCGAAVHASGGMVTDVRGDVVSALMNLGYRQADCAQAVERAGAGGEGSFENLLKLALRELAGA